MTLTDTQTRAMQPANKRLRTSDGGGLFIEVLPSGKKVFRLTYRVHGSQRTKMIGEYPRTTLADARLKAAAFEIDLQSDDPDVVKEATRTHAEIKSTEAKVLTWKEVADDYLLLRQQSGPSPQTLSKLNRQIGITVEARGKRPISEITAEDVLGVVNPIAASGRVETAHEVRTRFSQVFRYAGARGLINHDPSAFTIGAMVSRRLGSFAGISAPKEVGKLKAFRLELESRGIPLRRQILFILFWRMDYVSTFAICAPSAFSEIH